MHAPEIGINQPTIIESTNIVYIANYCVNDYISIFILAEEYQKIYLPKKLTVLYTYTSYSRMMVS